MKDTGREEMTVRQIECHAHAVHRPFVVVFFSPTRAIRYGHLQQARMNIVSDKLRQCCTPVQVTELLEGTLAIQQTPTNVHLSVATL